ncbi:MAG: hypothetical protein IPH34_08560 [Chitinophagaceae bacterium]|nr:hypothetical protein [Chitinophagaceae bacterium]MBK8606295.1 hypothetical protein [Chitinophagaceae bacterium]MBP6417209.1 hypothetical protein [Chitinophagaceae bacterium]MBP7109878.1 hypothetical protein [Chitinophagaceae bacterium]MBP7316137.1 hypothetical protein [Chitinophagaceae bacterium]
MRKSFIAVCLFFLAFNSTAQNKTIDSLKNLLPQTTKPIDRFRIIEKILENLNSFSGNADSTLAIELLKIAQQQNDAALLASSYNWIGIYLSLAKGDNTTALEYYFKALPLAIKTKDKRRTSSLYFDIALVYLYLQNTEEMVKFNQLGKDNLPEKTHPLYDYMLVQYQRGMSTYFLLQNQPDSALHYAQALMENSQRTNSRLYEYAALHLTGSAFAAKAEKELAEIYFNKTLALTEFITSNSAILRFELGYIPYLLNENRLLESKVQANRLLSLGNQYNNNNLKLAGAGFMRQIFDAANNKDSAYYFSRMEADINARIFSQDNTNKIQALAFNEQIRSIEEEAKQAEAAQQRKQNIQYALLALGIISFVILFLALSRRHITNTKVIQFLGVIALLVVFEFLNLLLHPFLERITHHNPILMLLALVCIAALLVPLHHKLEKWATHKLVEKNKQIRLAAAKKTIEELEK